MSRKTGAEVLVACLEKEGVRKVFGISGHGVTVLLEAMRREPGLDFISPRHEESAAHMADGWARATGGVGVCVSTVGPGAVNQAAGLAEAYADSIPVLAITANLQSFLSYPAVGFLEDMDTLNFYRPITKWNAVVHRRDRMAELVQRAFREARSGRPGPVHLDVPLDVLCQSGAAVELPGPEFYRPAGRLRGDAASIERAMELLEHAERPLLIAGGGVIASEAWEEFRALAKKLGIPATTSPMGAGCLAADGAGFFGDSGWLGGGAVIQALDMADVVLAVGCRFSAWLGMGRPPVMAGAPPQKIIHVDIDPREIGKNVGVAVGIVGDAKAVLADMLAVVRAGRMPATGTRPGRACSRRPTPGTWRACNPCWGRRRGPSPRAGWPRRWATTSRARTPWSRSTAGPPYSGPSPTYAPTNRAGASSSRVGAISGPASRSPMRSSWPTPTTSS